MTEEVASYIINHPQVKVAAKIIHDIILLDEFGLKLPDIYIHRIWESKEKLWELRTRFARNQERTLFFIVSNDRFLLTNAFSKSGKKVSKRDITRAEHIYYEFLAVEENNL